VLEAANVLNVDSVKSLKIHYALNLAGIIVVILAQLLAKKAIAPHVIPDMF